MRLLSKDMGIAGNVVEFKTLAADMSKNILTNDLELLLVRVRGTSTKFKGYNCEALYKQALKYNKIALKEGAFKRAKDTGFDVDLLKSRARMFKNVDAAHEGHTLHDLYTMAVKFAKKQHQYQEEDSLEWHRSR